MAHAADPDPAAQTASSQDPGLSVNRGVAVLNGRVLALDAAMGREIWTNVADDPPILFPCRADAEDLPRAAIGRRRA